MPITDSLLYEQFVAARLKAVELTDTYRDMADGDPRRAVLWEDVMRQTELARGLLESFLRWSPPVRPRAEDRPPGMRRSAYTLFSVR